jgi:hypothetical protein
MRMMALQLLGSLLILGAGLVALWVARRESAASPRRPAWLLTGWVWLVHGIIQLAQNLWGSWAMMSAPDSGVMGGYLAWAPALNHSRTFLWLAACLVLVWLTFAPRPPDASAWGMVIAALGAGAVAGAGFGHVEGALRPLTHYSNVAVLDALELVLFLGTLFATLLRDRVDRYLWAGLLVWALTVAINILWFAALSLVEDSRAWTPSPSAMGVYRAGLLSLLLAVFLRRLALARRGVPVAGFVPEPRPTGALGL